MRDQTTRSALPAAASAVTGLPRSTNAACRASRSFDRHPRIGDAVKHVDQQFTITKIVAISSTNACTGA